MPRRARRSSTASRSARPTKGGSKGYDAGKRISGRKRHILTDTDGRLLAVQVHGADIQDRDGGRGVLKRSRSHNPFVQRAYADGGYAGRLVAWAKDKINIVLEIVRRNATAQGVEVLRRLILPRVRGSPAFSVEEAQGQTEAELIQGWDDSHLFPVRLRDRSGDARL